MQRLVGPALSLCSCVAVSAQTGPDDPASAGPLATLRSVVFDPVAPTGNRLVLTNAVQRTVP